ncbi:MgtC/SapB family protein [Paenibacillus harenae]|uniref:MgtC/SapB family protein n=1 Tax=Paenibacillus harenae TaxID=306543 RepID=UPI00041E9AA7|nr:MgtC/SapB family protein [Paenibacillus harenae]
MELLHYDPSVWQIGLTEMALRLLMALGLGGLIGLERELGGHSAGFRTHILVCLGSAVIVLLSIYGFADFASEPNVRLDPARLAAQVISGVGFLGAGTIMRNGFGVSGLTTAASLWVSAAIGLAAGAGFYVGAVIATLLVVISLFALNKLEKRFSRGKMLHELKITVDKNSSGLNYVLKYLNTNGMQINKIAVDNEVDTGKKGSYLTLRIHLKLKKSIPFEETIASLAFIDGVIGFESGPDTL